MIGRVIPLTDLARQHDELRADLDRAWQSVSRTDAYIGGEALACFESRFAARCDRRVAVGVGSGTDALELALRAAGVGPGDEVIVPAMTFVATAAAVVMCGARPVFVDVDPATVLMTADAVTAAIGPRTAAVIPVHLYGNPVGADVIDVAARADLFVLEDCAQAHGATVGGRVVGSLGDAGAFSFYPSKNLGAFGDGGAVVTDDPELAGRIRRFGSHGRLPTGEFDHLTPGRTSRLDGLQAALLDVKLDHLDEWNQRRRAVMAAYRRRLPAHLQPVAPHPDTVPAPHLCVVRVPDRARVRSQLSALGIGTGVHYERAVTETAAFAGHGSFPAAEEAGRTVLSLPLHPHLTEAEVAYVVESLTSVVDGS